MGGDVPVKILLSTGISCVMWMDAIQKWSDSTQTPTNVEKMQFFGNSIFFLLCFTSRENSKLNLLTNRSAFKIRLWIPCAFFLSPTIPLCVVWMKWTRLCREVKHQRQLKAQSTEPPVSRSECHYVPMINSHCLFFSVSTCDSCKKLATWC